MTIAEDIVANMTSLGSRAAYIDANIILRYLTGQPPEMAAETKKVLAAAERDEIQLLITTVTLAEVVWTLSSVYRLTRSEIAAELMAFVTADGLETENLHEVTLALSLYRTGNMDFADALLAARSLLVGPPVVYSFDRDFDRIPGVRRLIPGTGDASESSQQP